MPHKHRKIEVRMEKKTEEKKAEEGTQYPPIEGPWIGVLVDHLDKYMKRVMPDNPHPSQLIGTQLAYWEAAIAVIHLIGSQSDCAHIGVITEDQMNERFDELHQNLHEIAGATAFKGMLMATDPGSGIYLGEPPKENGAPNPAPVDPHTGKRMD